MGYLRYYSHVFDFVEIVRDRASHDVDEISHPAIDYISKDPKVLVRLKDRKIWVYHKESAPQS